MHVHVQASTDAIDVTVRKGTWLELMLSVNVHVTQTADNAVFDYAPQHAVRYRNASTYRAGAAAILSTKACKHM